MPLKCILEIQKEEIIKNPQSFANTKIRQNELSTTILLPSTQTTEIQRGKIGKRSEVVPWSKNRYPAWQPMNFESFFSRSQLKVN